jgi:hypothetical protein
MARYTLAQDGAEAFERARLAVGSSELPVLNYPFGASARRGRTMLSMSNKIDQPDFDELYRDERSVAGLPAMTP